MESRKKASVTACAFHGWHQSVVAGRCELCKAISEGDLDGVRKWLTPENMESKGRRGWTPLVFACQSGHVEVLRYLISAGANINTVDNRRWSLLHHVNSPEVARILLDSGVDVNHKAKYGDTPLHVSGSKELDVVRLLLESGADVFAVDTVGRTPLARFNYGVPQTSLLLEYFGDASVRCKRKECRCLSTLLMCSYRKAFMCRHGVGMYDRFIIKMMLAGFSLAQGNQIACGLPIQEVLLFVSRREAFREECLAELGRMRQEKVPGSNVTYHRVFNQYPSALRNPVVQQALTPEHCNQAFHVYGETLRQRLVAGLRKLTLLDRAVDSFEEHVQPLLPECVAKVLNYLGTEDLKNLLIVCTGPKNLKRLICQTPFPDISKVCKRENEMFSEARSRARKYIDE